MKNIFLIISVVVGIISNPSIADYTSEETNDQSKTTFGEVNAVFGSRENSHSERRRTYDGPNYNSIPGRFYNAPINVYPTPNSPCSLQTGCPLIQGPNQNRPEPARLQCSHPNGCPLPRDPNQNRQEPSNVYPGARLPCSHPNGCPLARDTNQNRPGLNGQTNTLNEDNLASSGNGQTSTNSGRGSSASGSQQDSNYQQPYPPTQGYYPPGQVDPGFARFPPPQQGGPMPNFYPSGQNNYPYSQQPPYGLTNPSGYSQFQGSNQNPPQGNHHHQHASGGAGYHSWDHSLKENSEYTEVGHHKTGFQGYSNGLGYGNGINYGGYQRHGY